MSCPMVRRDGIGYLRTQRNSCPCIRTSTQRSPLRETSAPTIELISSPEYPTGATSVSVQLRVSDSDGLHQVILHAHGGVKAWQGMKGEQDAIVEFDYDGTVGAPPHDDLIGASLSSPSVHPIYVHAVDTGGTIGRTSFELFNVSTQDNLIATLEGHTSTVNSVAFSPNGAHARFRRR